MEGGQGDRVLWRALVGVITALCRKLNILYAEKNSTSVAPGDRNRIPRKGGTQEKWKDLEFGMRGSALGCNSSH